MRTEEEIRNRMEGARRHEAMMVREKKYDMARTWQIIQQELEWVLEQDE